MKALGKFNEVKAQKCNFGMEYVNGLNPMSIQDVKESNDPTLQDLKDYRVDGYVEILVKRLFAEVDLALGYEKTLSSDRIDILTKFILDDFWYFKISDLKLAFKNGVKGRYGKLYQHLDIPTIFNWLDTYKLERNKFISKPESK